MAKKIVSTQGTDNVFADLQLEDAEELHAKSTLAIMLRKLIKEQGLTQVQAATLLETHQTQIARLNNIKGVRHMSLDLLMHWLTKFHQDVIVTVKKAPRSHTMGQIRIVV